MLFGKHKVIGTVVHVWREITGVHILANVTLLLRVKISLHRNSYMSQSFSKGKDELINGQSGVIWKKILPTYGTFSHGQSHLCCGPLNCRETMFPRACVYTWHAAITVSLRNQPLAYFPGTMLTQPFRCQYAGLWHLKTVALRWLAALHPTPGQLLPGSSQGSQPVR